MFLHSFKYNLLRTIRNKTQLFWSFLFTIALGTIFCMVFSDIYEKNDVFHNIKVAAYIDEPIVKDVFKEIEENAKNDSESDEKLLEVTYAESMDDALKLLEDKEVIGVFYSEGYELKLKLLTKGVSESILSQIVVEYHKMMSLQTSQPVNQDVSVEAVEYPISENKEISFGTGNNDVFQQYFYNLIAMSCLFASFVGLGFAIDTQANLSTLGARIELGENNKFVSAFGGLLSMIIELSLLTFIATIYLNIIGAKMGTQYQYIFLITFAGNMLGVGFGYFIGKISSLPRKIKEAIVTGGSLFLCFLSGLMIGDMRMRVEEVCPLINKINPAVLVSDSFVSLNQFGDMDRYMNNVITMIVMAIVLIIAGLLLGRRKQYASI